MDTLGEWFFGCSMIIIILVALSPIILMMQRRQPIHNRELDELPSFVNPEMVQERLSIPTQRDIDFPPAAHVRTR
jgi:hypothetical protein